MEELNSILNFSIDVQCRMFGSNLFHFLVFIFPILSEHKKRYINCTFKKSSLEYTCSV